MSDPVQIVSQWEKFGLVGICLLAVVALALALIKLVRWMMSKHEETTRALREEIGRREVLIEAHQAAILRMTTESTAVNQRCCDAILANTEAMKQVAAGIAWCQANRNGVKS